MGLNLIKKAAILGVVALAAPAGAAELDRLQTMANSPDQAQEGFTGDSRALTLPSPVIAGEQAPPSAAVPAAKAPALTPAVPAPVASPSNDPSASPSTAGKIVLGLMFAAGLALFIAGVFGAVTGVAPVAVALYCGIGAAIAYEGASGLFQKKAKE